MPKYRFCTALGLSPVQFTVAPPGWQGEPETAQLPPPGGVYDGPPSRTSAAALDATLSSASIPRVVTLFIVNLPCARCGKFAETVPASAPAAVLPSSG